MDQIKEDAVTNIRACIISVKGSLPLRKLPRDYESIIGERIPYKECGYTNLTDFIRSIPTLKIVNVGNEQCVEALVSDKSKHIVDMVNKQKPPKNKNFRSSGFRNIPHTTQWRPKAFKEQAFRPRKSSSRPSTVCHSQFISRPNSDTNSTKIQPSSLTTTNTPPLSALNISKNGPVFKRPVFGKRDPEISFDRDSGNSSPTDDNKIGLQLDPVSSFHRSGDDYRDLKQFAIAHNLGEIELKQASMRQRKSIQHTCSIKVDSQWYLSYPNEFYDAEAAKQFCAKKALDYLLENYNKKKVSVLSSTNNVIERVVEMLRKHNMGVWSTQIEANYVSQYNEGLPINWIQIIDSSECVDIMSINDRWILHYCKPGSDLQKGQRLQTNLGVVDVSIPANTIEFTNGSELVALVKYVSGFNEIWCQQCNTVEYDNYSNLEADMQIYYSNSKNMASTKASVVQAGSYYVVNHETQWRRVRAVEVDKDRVLCFLVDRGDEIWTETKNLHSLKMKFASSQAQVFVCCLVGLEDLYEMSVDSQCLAKVLPKNKSVILEPAIDDELDEKDVIPVIMYDFEKLAEEESTASKNRFVKNEGGATTTSDSKIQSINEELILMMTIESATPVFKMNEITEVYVSHVTNSGYVYIHVRSSGYERLTHMLDQLEKDIIKKPPVDILESITKENSKDRLYFAKVNGSNKYQRLKIIDWSPTNDFAQVQFIDYGNTQVIRIPMENLYPLDKISDIINQYPALAIGIRMAMNTVPENFSELASKFLPPHVSIVLKIVELTEDGYYVGEFYKRSFDVGIFCVNKSIEVESSLAALAPESNVEHMKKKLARIGSFDDQKTKNIVPSGGHLQGPPLPNRNDFFEVRVSFSVNPWNFFVQPLVTYAELTELMSELQLTLQYVQPKLLPIETIKPGEIYATKHTDGTWYRTSVLKVINSGSISVFYCDFGYYSNLTLDKLVPLDDKFRKLPYQALKATLSSVKPKNDNWSMEDCSVFNSLVANKSFVSVIVDIQEDELYKSDKVLKLKLIDTSTEDDIYIDKELIKKGIALKTVN